MFTLSPFTQAQLDKLKSKLVMQGSSVQQVGLNSYRIVGSGITADAVFDGSSLQVSIVHKPFFVSVGMIQSGIESALQES